MCSVRNTQKCDAPFCDACVTGSTVVWQHHCQNIIYSVTNIAVIFFIDPRILLKTIWLNLDKHSHISLKVNPQGHCPPPSPFPANYVG